MFPLADALRLPVFPSLRFRRNRTTFFLLLMSSTIYFGGCPFHCWLLFFFCEALGKRESGSKATSSTAFNLRLPCLNSVLSVKPEVIQQSWRESRTTEVPLRSNFAVHIFVLPTLKISLIRKEIERIGSETGSDHVHNCRKF